MTWLDARLLRFALQHPRPILVGSLALSAVTMLAVFGMGSEFLPAFNEGTVTVGLQLQPEMTPMIFARYFRERRTFSQTAGMTRAAGRIGELLEREIGKAATEAAVFMGRVGAGSPATSRSLRLPLERLMIDRNDAA